MDRDTFLDRVRRASAAAELPAAPTVSPALPSLEREDLVGLFVERATAVNAMVHGPMRSTRIPRAVERIASEHGCESFVIWDDVPVPGVASALTTAGCRRVPHEIVADDRLELQLALRDLDCGITGADAGLAESGSVVLAHGPGRPRMASLIPDVHVVLLEVAAIHRSLVHWAHRNPELVSSTANLVVISGPSRTGDIELQLNLGVHGPRIVHIVLVRP